MKREYPPLYRESRAEARRQGELAEWKQSHQANVKCARDIENLIGSHTQDGQLEADCARAALDWWGFRRVQFVLSNTLPSADAQGFDTNSLRWVQTAFVPSDRANGEFKVRADAALTTPPTKTAMPLRTATPPSPLTPAAPPAPT